MGEEIQSRAISKNDLEAFRQRVLEETKILQSWFESNSFSSSQNCFGFELEGWLINQDGLPAPKNQKFLQQLNEPEFVPELSQFNFEVNSRVHKLNSNLISQIHDELDAFFNKSYQAAHKLNLHPIWIGILPTVRDNMLNLDSMSQQNRYFALAERILELRKNNSVRLKIDRFDNLDIQRADIMSEAAATSLQIHTQVNQESAIHAYNAAVFVSAPLIAVTANSPFLYGHKLWDETRIPVFEQTLAVSEFSDTKILDPVTLGEDYARSSFHNLFQENVENYPIILPELFNDSPENLRHLKFLNGQIWRWVRPIVGTSQNSKPHLRIEQRSIPAGPSAVDMAANIAFYVGLLQIFSNKDQFPVEPVTFVEAKKNFYECAKLGMKAKIKWGNDKELNVQKLLHDELLSLAEEGLRQLGINNEEIDYYIGDVMKNRVRTGWTGAAWQKSFIENHGPDFQAMTMEYLQRQESRAPVYKWKI